MTFGNVHFAPREFQVMQLVAQGLQNREIGRLMGTSTNCVKNYLTNIYDKTGMGNRVELSLWYLAHRGDHAL